ncbi:hypothetical protein FRC00_003973, partial [Tulasnella sp. 408]
MSAAWYDPTLNIDQFLNDHRNVAEGVREVALMYPTWLCRRFLASGARVRQRFGEYMNKSYNRASWCET